LFLCIKNKIYFYSTKKLQKEDLSGTSQAIKSDKIAFYACALKFWQSQNLTVDNSTGKT
jgi:hypothetical protein